MHHFARGWRRAMSVGTHAALVASLGACTVQDRYQQIRNSNASECDRLVTQNERDRCKAQLPPASYEEYERQRRSALKDTDTGNS